MTYKKNVMGLIGNTPLIELKNLNKSKASIFAKLEMFNPGSSVKDRIALNMIKNAEKTNKLKPGGTIVEPTSGNTGIGLALIGAASSYNVILTMPDTMSTERRKLLKAFGAELILTPGDKGMKGAIEKAEELVAENDNYFMPQQFKNPANPEIHYQTTGPEILKTLDRPLDYFVAGVGTGGTLTGAGKYIKEKNPEAQIIAVEPADSAILSGKKPGSHQIQGIGAGFIPDILDVDLIDDIIAINNEEARIASRKMARQEGLLVGISSGAAIAAATKIASNCSGNKVIVAIAPDSGERYLSTDLFND